MIDTGSISKLIDRRLMSSDLHGRIRDLAQVLATARFDQELKTMLAFESRQRRRRRTEYATLAILVSDIELLAKFETVRSHATQIRPMDQQTRERHERRIRMVLPVAKLFVVEAFIILRTRMSQSVVIRMIRLNQNSSGTIAAPGTSRDLSDELKRSLRRSEIR